jgi:hypothetical protein
MAMDHDTSKSRPQTLEEQLNAQRESLLDAGIRLPLRVFRGTAVPNRRDSNSPLPYFRLYRAHIAAGPCGTERTAFVEAASHQDAARKIANAVAAFESRLPDAVAERIYNVTSARELISEGLSGDIELRLFETGWCREAASFVQEPLFLLAAPAGLICKWAQTIEMEVSHV